MQKKVFLEEEEIQAFRELSPTIEHSPVRSELDHKNDKSRNSLDHNDQTPIKSARYAEVK